MKQVMNNETVLCEILPKIYLDLPKKVTTIAIL
jgi:hypothetical protein